MCRSCGLQWNVRFGNPVPCPNRPRHETYIVKTDYDKFLELQAEFEEVTKEPDLQFLARIAEEFDPCWSKNRTVAYEDLLWVAYQLRDRCHE